MTCARLCANSTLVSKVEPQFERSDAAAIQQSLAQELQPFVKPDKADQAARVVTTFIQRVHQGPLPAPDDMAHYEQILPGCAERILQMTEREQEHRHRQERRGVGGEYGTRFAGQAATLLIALAMVFVVGFTAYVGLPVAASVITAIGGVCAIVLRQISVGVPQPANQSGPPAKPKRRTR
ncbi:DUF2335 domain-containing protein [Novosphingobium capsulatum]|uniref:DUF2335 domain-containing protein n=1 Tax=Novosphingobium capsulatum TaxID=13688 RepID=UPI0009FEC899